MYYQRRTDTTYANPVVGRRELEYRQKMHRDKIQRMSSAIDTRPPAPQPHLTLYGRDYVAKKRATTEAAFSDLKMIQSIARTMTRPLNIPNRAGPVSLNSGARKQEIFRVMHENHRLLNSLETLQPVVSTSDLIRNEKWRQRYIINSSHSKRLSGEYDDLIEQHNMEDTNKLESYKRSVELRRAQRSNGMSNSGSYSMPSLTGPSAGATSAGQLGASGGSTSSAPLPGEIKKKQRPQHIGGSAQMEKLPQAKSNEKNVSFGDADTTSPQNLASQRKTPHPKTGGGFAINSDAADEIIYDDATLPSGATVREQVQATVEVAAPPMETKQEAFQLEEGVSEADFFDNFGPMQTVTMEAGPIQELDFNTVSPEQQKAHDETESWSAAFAEEPKIELTAQVVTFEEPPDMQNQLAMETEMAADAFGLAPLATQSDRGIAAAEGLSAEQLQAETEAAAAAFGLESFDDPPKEVGIGGGAASGTKGKGDEYEDEYEDDFNDPDESHVSPNATGASVRAKTEDTFEEDFEESATFEQSAQ